jgi:hypothetical protein
VRPRRGLLTLPLASLLLLGACAAPAPTPVEGPSHTPRPEAAILVSIPGEAVYLVDPVTGDRQVVDQALADLAAGYAQLGPRPPNRRLRERRDRHLPPCQPGQDVDPARRRHLEPGLLVRRRPAGVHRRRHAAGHGPSRLPRTHQALPAHRPRRRGSCWRPGSAIAFQGVDLECRRGAGCVSTDRSEIWTTQPDGSAPTRLTLVGHAESPKWAPDGERLLFIPAHRAGDRAAGQGGLVHPPGRHDREVPADLRRRSGRLVAGREPGRPRQTGER